MPVKFRLVVVLSGFNNRSFTKRFLAQQKKDPQQKVAFPLYLKVFEVLSKITLQTKTERGYPREDVKLPVPIEGIGDKVLDQLISIGEN